MDFNLRPEQSDLIGRIRRFVDEELLPLEPALLVEGPAAVLPDIRRLRARVQELGMWAPNHPREYGGLGLDTPMPHQGRLVLCNASGAGHAVCDSPALCARTAYRAIPAGRLCFFLIAAGTIPHVTGGTRGRAN